MSAASRSLRVEPAEVSFVEPFASNDHQRSLRVTNVGECQFSIVAVPHAELQAADRQPV